MNAVKIEKRNLERKPHELRAEGFIPGMLYGDGITHFPVKLVKSDFHRMMSKAGEIYKIKTKDGDFIAKVAEIQIDPLTREINHVSFQKMTKGIEDEVTIPLELEGKPEGLKKGGSLIILIDDISVKGRPSEIPDKIKVDISHLDIGEKIRLSDITIPETLELMEDETKVLALCRPPVEEDPSLSQDDNNMPNMELAQAVP